MVRCQFRSKGNDSSTILNLILEEKFFPCPYKEVVGFGNLNLFVLLLPFYFFLILVWKIHNWLLMRSKNQKSSGQLYLF
jgi:hypothetical protein